MPFRLRLAAVPTVVTAISAAFLLAACGDTAAPLCIPGQTAFCSCFDGAEGVWTCDRTGFYGLCDCSISTPADPVCGPGGQINDDDDFEELMYPGRDCIGCHLDENDKDEDEAPIYTAAGTVMPHLHYEDHCEGVEGVVVEITGADGEIVRLVSNRVGNFFTRRRIATPYTARVVTADSERLMTTPQHDLNCANCHTARGDEEAPGRIIPPP